MPQGTKEEIDAREGEAAKVAADEAKAKAEKEAARLDELEAENRGLRERLASSEAARPKAAPAQRRVTAAELRALSEEQRAWMQDTYKQPFDSILSAVEIQERQEQEARMAAVESDRNVRDAIEDLVSEDPQAGKLKKHIRAFMEDIPAADKLDPAALKRRMAQAVAYARGLSGVPAASSKGEKEMEPNPRPGGSGAGDDEGGESGAMGSDGRVKPGKHVLIPGQWEIEIEDRVPQSFKGTAADFARAGRHPTDPNGAMFMDKGKKPKFGT